mmetsp:Transcript_9311/g.27798  ORF Transcript_9311/g.27798 Transcript_9311/m.27798 type:complete len:223 (+) Transcript_9311:280-948(+)
MAPGGRTPHAERHRRSHGKPLGLDQSGGQPHGDRGSHGRGIFLLLPPAGKREARAETLRKHGHQHGRGKPGGAGGLFCQQVSRTGQRRRRVLHCRGILCGSVHSDAGQGIADECRFERARSPQGDSGGRSLHGQRRPERFDGFRMVLAQVRAHGQRGLRRLGVRRVFGLCPEQAGSRRHDWQEQKQRRKKHRNALVQVPPIGRKEVVEPRDGRRSQPRPGPH